MMQWFTRWKIKRNNGQRYVSSNSPVNRYGPSQKYNSQRNDMSRNEVQNTEYNSQRYINEATNSRYYGQGNKNDVVRHRQEGHSFGNRGMRKTGIMVQFTQISLHITSLLTSVKVGQI